MKEYKFYEKTATDNGVSIFRLNGADYVGVDLDDGEQIRIKDKFLSQFVKAVQAAGYMEDLID